MKTKGPGYSPNRVSRFRSPKKRLEYIKKLTYEYITKEEKIEKVREEVYTHDPKTGQKLFHPKVVPHHSLIIRSNSPTGGDETETPGSAEKPIHKRDIFEDILQRDADAVNRKKALAQQKLELEIKFIEKSRACALDHSNYILQESTNKQIFKIFSSLIECTNVSEVAVDAGNRQLDLMQVKDNMLAEDVYSVFHEGNIHLQYFITVYFSFCSSKFQT